MDLHSLKTEPILHDPESSSTTDVSPHTHLHAVQIPNDASVSSEYLPGGDSWCRLMLRQGPTHAKVATGGKTDSPIYPPPVVELIAPSGRVYNSLYVFMHASLVPEDYDTQTESPKLSSRCTLGCLVSSRYRLIEGDFFVFPDVRISVLGRYKLYFTLFKQDETDKPFYHLIGSLLSNTFEVYTARRWFTTPTRLTQKFRSQGVGVQLRPPCGDRGETKPLLPRVNVGALYAQSFKAHEEHFILLLNTKSASELQEYAHDPVSMAIQGIGNCLYSLECCTAAESIAGLGPRTNDSLRATSGMHHITAATTLSETGSSLTRLQCQLLRVIYYLLAAQLEDASIELQKLGEQLHSQVCASPTVGDDAAAVFWAYVILDSYSLVNPMMPLWYLPHMGRINLPTWDDHPAMQKIKDKCDDMKYHILVREHFLNETSGDNEPAIGLQSMVDEMQARAEICSLEAAGAIMLLHKPFLDNIYNHEHQLDFENNRNRLQQSLFWVEAVVKKAQAQHAVQRKQSLHLETFAMRILVYWYLRGETPIPLLLNYLMDLLLFVWNAPVLYDEYDVYRNNITLVCISQQQKIMGSTHYLRDVIYCQGEEPKEVPGCKVLSSTQPEP